MRIRTGDTVRILAGKDKGKTGKVVQVLPSYDKVVVEGLHMATKHLRGRSNQKGKKIAYAAPMHISNVAVVTGDAKTGRVGYRLTTVEGKTRKQRVLRRAKMEITLE